ncbi:MAG: 30S ribosome-binding factor RbfA [Dehalococcoidia bacterium]|jgi:ribosome-binding factor A|nr:MAG: 30S ribosome-binding factor RbfA [Dehalococcoidia bacterium]TEU16660.1 MAG: 30S ribosome-binding factor RbfA [Dehalococcoidia bacterium]
MSRRSERTSKLIQREISRLLEREVNDPRLSKLISVTEVALSPDLKYAKIFVSTLGSEIDNKEEMLAGFNNASGFLRKELASHLKLRYTPQLSFHYDDSIERGARLLKLMGDLTATE